MKQLAVASIVVSIVAACSEERAWDGPTASPRASEAPGDAGVQTGTSEADSAIARNDASVALGGSDGGADGGVPLELSSPPAVPDGWVRVTGEYGISFAAPAPGLVAKPPKCGVDSCSVPFEGGECSYLADRNQFVDQLEHYEAPDYLIKNVRIDGMVARFVESARPQEDSKYMLAIALYVPNGIRPGLDRSVAGAYASCPSAESAATARIVLQSLALAPRP